MKQIRIALCLALLGFLALPAAGFALPVGNPYKTGSLMVFPLVDLSGDNDTVIAITNSFYHEVNVACWYRSVSDEVGGAVFAVGADDTVWFSLKTGEGSMPAPFYLAENGEVKCWAVNEAGTEQISWNYLQGLAEISDAQNRTWGYSSWNFAADKPRGAAVGEAGVIRLSGLSGQYDAMPKYLNLNVPGTVSEAKVTLVLGKQDLRQDRENVYSKAKFTYSKGGTSSTQCLIDQVQTSIRKSLLSSFKVQGIASTVCDVLFDVLLKTTQNAPLLGVLQERRKSSTAVFGIMPIGMGADGSGYILWDPDSGVERKAR
jgi:hypothetical protein